MKMESMATKKKFFKDESGKPWLWRVMFPPTLADLPWKGLHTPRVNFHRKQCLNWSKCVSPLIIKPRLTQHLRTRGRLFSELPLGVLLKKMQRPSGIFEHYWTLLSLTDTIASHLHFWLFWHQTEQLGTTNCDKNLVVFPSEQTKHGKKQRL